VTTGAADNGKPTAFVIMPFGDGFDVVWEIIQRPLVEAGYHAKRADTDPNHGSVLADIVRGIADARLVVADLTDSNANVFYELGLSHGLRVPTILITQSVEGVPFDLRMYRLEPYGTEYSKARDFQDRLREAAERYLSNDLRFGSPVMDYLPAAEPTAPSAAEPVDPAKSDAKRQALQALLSALQPATHDVLTTFQLVLESWDQSGTVLNTLVERLDDLEQESGEATRVAVQQIASEAKTTVDTFTESMAVPLTKMVEQVRYLTEIGTGFSVALNVQLDRDPSDVLYRNLAYFSRGLEGTYQGATNAIQAAVGFKQMLVRFRGRHADIDASLGRAEGEVDRLTSASLALQAFALGTSNLLGERLGRFVDVPELDDANDDDQKPE
jgi:hypothetical protein